jgi:hypothetical protein
MSPPPVKRVPKMSEKAKVALQEKATAIPKKRPLNETTEATTKKARVTVDQPPAALNTVTEININDSEDERNRSRSPSIEEIPAPNETAKDELSSSACHGLCQSH